MVADDETIDWRGFRAYPWNLPDDHYGAYCFTNLVKPDKRYIGVAGLSNGSDLDTRVYEHSKMGKSTGRKFKNALLKYGRENFLIEPIYHWIFGPVINKELLQIESKLIKSYDSVKNGYNTQEESGPDANYGKEFSDNVKAALADPETKKRHRQAVKEALANPDTKARQSAAAKRMQADPELQARRIANLTAALNTPESREKRSAILKETHSKPEVKALISQRSKEMWENEEIRQKILESSNANWSDPEKKSSYLAAMAAGRDHPDHKARLSAASKAHRNDPDAKAAYSALMKSLVWITDGTKNRRVPPSEPLSDGWRLGRAPGLYTPERLERWKNRMAEIRGDPEYKAKLNAGQTAAWANDEDRRKRASSTMKNMRSSEGAIAHYESVKGSIWITDGTKCRRIRPEDSIPDGWYRGKLSSKGETKA